MVGFDGFPKQKVGKIKKGKNPPMIPTTQSQPLLAFCVFPSYEFFILQSCNYPLMYILLCFLHVRHKRFLLNNTFKYLLNVLSRESLTISYL